MKANPGRHASQLTRRERAEIDCIYNLLDADWIPAGNATVPARAPWSAEDIAEWRKLSPAERIMDLRIYAQACDRITGGTALPLAA
ncbi:MAG: hypothetical protein JOY71_08655 [Acetobacteraceae bacterium]|nr:hypothetical protein [Acetobacteraceae bacterium]